MYDRQYARDVLRMPVPTVPLRADDLHRHAEVVAHMGTKRSRGSTERSDARVAPAARAAPATRAAAPRAPASAPVDDEAELWCQDDAEAATMALELELEEDLLLRESQLAQELDE